jgi:hypothetical protein
LGYENGLKETPLGILHAISSKYNVKMTALITVEVPLEIVRKDKDLNNRKKKRV